MEKQEELCQWLTPPGVAREFYAWARIKDDDVVLEPAAGEGALIPRDRRNVLAFEVDPERVVELQYWKPNATIICADFLATAAPKRHVADVCIQNPPYSNSGEGLFVARSLLWAPRVCALVRTGAIHGKDRFEVCWSHVSLTRIAYFKYRPKFEGPYGLPTEYTPAYDYIAIEAELRNGREVDQPEMSWVDWR